MEVRESILHFYYITQVEYKQSSTVIPTNTNKKKKPRTFLKQMPSNFETQPIAVAARRGNNPQAELQIQYIFFWIITNPIPTHKGTCLNTCPSLNASYSQDTVPVITRDMTRVYQVRYMIYYKYTILEINLFIIARKIF